jgi:hypothetical protein
MAKPKKKSPPAKKPAKPKKQGGASGGGAGGPQMGIGDFMQQQFEDRAGKKPKRG